MADASGHADERPVLCLPWSNGLARTVRLLQVAEALRALGRRVVFAGDGRYVCGAASVVRGRGFEARPLLDLEPEQVLLGTFDIHTEASAARFVEEELALYDALRPAAVLHDYRPTASISAEVAGVPSFALNNTDYTPFAARALKAPVDHPAARVLSALLGERLGRGIADRFAPRVARRLFQRAARPHNAVLARYGKPPRADILHVLEGTALNFITDAREWAPFDEVPDTYRFIGPLAWTPHEEQARWDALRARLEPERPLVYVTFGSTGRRDVFEALPAVLGARAERFVVTTGGQDALGGPVPDNVWVERFLPGDQVAASARAVVCHGGSGTLYQALLAGAPVVVIAMRGDQEWNAEEVERLGVGVAMSARSFLERPARLGAALERVTREPRYRAAASALGAKLRTYGGAAQAAAEIDRALEQVKR